MDRVIRSKARDRIVRGNGRARIIRGGKGAPGQSSQIEAPFWFSGPLSSDEIIGGLFFVGGATFSVVGGSAPSPPNGDQVYDLLLGDVPTGATVTFPDGETTPVLAGGPVVVPPNSYLRAKAPSAPPDNGFSEAAFTLSS